MIKLQRKEQKGDRNRSRISTPREMVIPTYGNGMVSVEVKYSGTAAALERKGFVRIPDAPRAKPLAPPPINPPRAAAPVAPVHPVVVEPEDSPLADMDHDELYRLAQQRNLKGRSKMSKAELLAALS